MYPEELMVGKLGEQLKLSGIETRTQRKIRQRDEAEVRRKINVAESDLSQANTVDEYEKKFENLDPKVKQFFTSPAQVRSRLNAERLSKIEKLQAKLEEVDRQRQINQDRFAQDEWRGRRNYLREQKVRLRGESEGIRKVLKQLRGGKNITLKSAERFAKESGEAKVKSRKRRLKLKKSEFGQVLKEEGFKVSASGVRQFLRTPDKKITGIITTVPAQTLEARTDSTEVKEEPTPVKKFFSDLGKAGGLISDVAGALFVKDITVSDVTKETTVTEAEAKAGQKRILLAGLRRDIFSIPKFDLFPAQVEALKFRRELRAGSEEAKGVRSKQETQVGAIKEAKTDLEIINQQVLTLQKQADDPNLSQEKAERLSRDVDKISQKRQEIFSTLEGKGVTVAGQSTEEGSTITFSSPELEADLTPAGFKQLRGASKTERTVRITGRLGLEATEFFAIGVATGSLGAGARLGGILTKVPKVVKIGGAVGLGGLIGFEIGKGGVIGFKRGKEEGIGLEGAVLGAGVPISQLTGFTAGAFTGSRVFASRTITKVKEGGFTETVTRRTGKGAKFPVKDEVKKIVSLRETPTVTKQLSISETRIPATKIKITQESFIKALETQKIASGEGIGRSVVTGLKGGGQRTFASRFFLVRKGSQTGIVVATQTKGGVLVQQVRSKALMKQILKGTPKVLDLGKAGASTQRINLEFTRTNREIAKTFLVKGGKISNIGKVFRKIDVNRLVKGFGDEPIISVSRTLQGGKIVKLTGKGATATRFETLGVTKGVSSARLNKLLSLIKTQIKRGDFLVIGKKGELFPKILPKPKVPSGIPSISPTFPQQDIGRFELGVVTDAITPEIRSALAGKTLSGVALLTPLGLQARDRLSDLQKEDLSVKLRELQKQQPLLREDIVQPQKQIPAQSSVQQEKLVQKISQIPQFETPTVTTPVTTVPIPKIPFIPAFTGLGLALGSPKGKKRKKKEEEFFQQQRIRGFLPDFTTKILGLEPLKVTEPQAEKLVRKVLTGFEIRRGAVIVK